LSEAVQQGLPVIVTHNAWTMPQERWNTQWVVQHRLGVVQRSFAKVPEAVDTLLSDLPGYRARAAAMHNRAVFEVPSILNTLWQQAAEQAAERAPQQGATVCGAHASSSS
jgi:hypothetical protein